MNKKPKTKKERIQHLIDVFGKVKGQDDPQHFYMNHIDTKIIHLALELFQCTIVEKSSLSTLRRSNIEKKWNEND